MAIMLDISPKKSYVFKYSGGLHNHLQKKVMLFNPKSVDEACVQEQYLENIGLKKGKLSGLKKKEQHDASKEGKKKLKGEKDKKLGITTH